MSAAEPETP